MYTFRLIRLLRQMHIIQKGITEGRTVQDKMGRKFLDNMDTRARTVLQRATEEGEGNPVPSLLLMLKSDDAEVCATAAQLLSEIDISNESFVTRGNISQALVDALHTTSLSSEQNTGVTIDRFAPLRINAVEALGKMRDPETVAHIVMALSDPHPGVRRAAAWALGCIGSPDAIPGLQGALSDDSLDARGAVIMALERIGTPEALDALAAWRHKQKTY
jgi:HEAT repeat protein